MSAYVIALVDVHDAETYARYRAGVPDCVASHGGRFLVRGGAQTPLEGTWPASRTVVIEFPDRAAAEAFYRSPAYQAILPLRLAASSGRVVIVDGPDGVRSNP